MSTQNRGVIIGLGGFFAGALASQMVAWPTLAKAALAAGVCVLVSLTLWALLRPRPDA